VIEQDQASPERQVHLLQQVPPAFSIVLVRPHQPFEGPGVPVGHLSVEILLPGRGFHLSEVVAGGAAILHTFLEKSRGRDARGANGDVGGTRHTLTNVPGRPPSRPNTAQKHRPMVAVRSVRPPLPALRRVRVDPASAVRHQ